MYFVFLFVNETVGTYVHKKKKNDHLWIKTCDDNIMMHPNSLNYKCN